MITERATLHRTRGPSWKFVIDGRLGVLVHRTKGRKYAILLSDDDDMYMLDEPYRLVLRQGRKWVRAPDTVLPMSIEFDSGAKYVFPERE